MECRLRMQSYSIKSHQGPCHLPAHALLTREGRKEARNGGSRQVGVSWIMGRSPPGLLAINASSSRKPGLKWQGGSQHLERKRIKNKTKHRHCFPRLTSFRFLAMVLYMNALHPASAAKIISILYCA